MYNVLFIAQMLAVILTFICVVMLILQRNTGIAKYMLLTCICSFIQNVGYLLEMCSQSASECLLALRVEYIGTSFVLTCMTMFVFKYCKVRLSDILKWILFLLGVVCLVSVWTYPVNRLYYSSAVWSTDGIFPHIVLTKGPLYIVASIVFLIEFICCIVVSFISAVRATGENLKKNYKLLAIACFIPGVFDTIGIVGLFEGYDSAPIGGAIGIMTFVFAIAFRHVFDIVEMAHDSILMDLEEAVIILDYQNGFKEANNSALSLFPELLKTPSGEPVKSDVLNDIIRSRGGHDIVINNHYYDVHFKDITSNKVTIGHTLTFFDTTEAKSQFDNITHLREVAESANQAKSTFLASVSHEIRTPINVVVGMSDVIMRDSQDEKMKGYAENIQEAARSLLALINDILDFSKIESGKTNLVNGDYETSKFFYDIINTYKHRGDEKNIKFDFKIDENIPSVLYGDETRIRQIMTNLLSNAFKYTQEGSVLFRAGFEWMGEQKGNLILSVEDTGIGIKKEDTEKLFEVFTRLDERINRAIEGTGLGLNITKQLIELMNGEIKVYSEYGKGSVFTAIIPQTVHGDSKKVIGNVDDYKPSKIERKKVAYTAPNASVLVVDDSKTNLIVAKALLRDTKVKITTATSGFECIDDVKANHYDVIFLDHRMPEMDGVETLHKMEEVEHKSEGVPVIMLTANAVSDARDYYLKEGFTDFISKPICEESITGILEKYLPESLIERN